MLKSDVISHYGSAPKVAEALGLTKAAVYAWDELVPPLSAAKLHKLTRGRLRFDPDVYDGWNNRKATA
jgi:hypothetical protein